MVLPLRRSVKWWNEDKEDVATRNPIRRRCGAGASRRLLPSAMGLAQLAFAFLFILFRSQFLFCFSDRCFTFLFLLSFSFLYFIFFIFTSLYI
jgi:hypothetical protein